MDKFIESIYEYRLNKEVKAILSNVLQNRRNLPNIALALKDAYHQGEISRTDYVYVNVRILLNDFCARAEEHIGKGVQTGFLLYCRSLGQLFYAAGKNYPQPLKHFLRRRTPTICMETDYVEEVYLVPSVKEWIQQPCIRDSFGQAFSQTDRQSLISKRMRYNGSIFGTFEAYFPTEHAYTDEDINWLHQELQPLKVELYKLRDEMLEALQTLEDHVVIPPVRGKK